MTRFEYKTPEGAAALERALNIGLETADRHSVDLEPYEVRELAAEYGPDLGVLSQLDAAMGCLFTWNDVTRPATAAPDVEAADRVIKLAMKVQTYNVLGELREALEAYDRVAASL